MLFVAAGSVNWYWPEPLLAGGPSIVQLVSGNNKLVVVHTVKDEL